MGHWGRVISIQKGWKPSATTRIILVSSYPLSLSFIPTLNLLINVRTLMIMKMYTLPPPPSLKWQGSFCSARAQAQSLQAHWSHLGSCVSLITSQTRGATKYRYFIKISKWFPMSAKIKNHCLRLQVGNSENNLIVLKKSISLGFVLIWKVVCMKGSCNVAIIDSLLFLGKNVHI